MSVYNWLIFVETETTVYSTVIILNKKFKKFEELFYLRFVHRLNKNQVEKLLRYWYLPLTSTKKNKCLHIGMAKISKQNVSTVLCYLLYLSPLT
jgi:hypothetical protein